VVRLLALNKELGTLFRIAAFTPFTFQDITTGFRTMYGSFQLMGISLKTTNDTIQSIADILSATGKTGTGAFNRISLALQHMVNTGRVTGQIVTQIGRDGIPLGAILEKQYGLTAAQMSNIASSGLSVVDVLNAINKATKTNPFFRGAALRQSNQTLGGAFSSFKDLLSQAAGGAVGGQNQNSGIFGYLRRQLAGVNNQLAWYYKNNKPITLMAFANAIDKQLSPKTHLLINLFILFKYYLIGLVGTFAAVLKGIQLVLKPFDALANAFDKNHTVAKLLGIVLGILVGLWILNAARIAIYELAMEAATIKTKAMLFWTTAMNVALRVQKANLEGGLIAAWVRYAFATKAAFSAGKWSTGLANMGLFAKFSRYLITTTRAMTAAFVEAEGGIAGMAAAMNVLVDSVPIVGWIIGLITLVTILYFKWKRFHDIVDSTFHMFTGGKHEGGSGLLRNLATASLPGPLGFIGLAGLAKRGAGLLGFATGGIMPYSGMAMVGERGPEMVYLPAGARIAPQAHTNVNSVGSLGSGSVGNSPIVVQVMLDRKVLAEAVARANQDQRNRR
jgi:hypothetical protein